MKLPKHLSLDNIPETGMGYHIVNIELTSGAIIKDVVILDSTFIMDLDIDPTSIKRIIPLNNKSK